MKFVQHSTTNMILTKPKGMDNCDNMPATMMIDDTTGETTIVSFWEPSAEELHQLKRGGRVALYVIGSMHPPVAIGVEESK